MLWKICLGICIALLAASVGFAGFLIFSKKRIKFPIAIFILFEFLGGVVLFFPVNWSIFGAPFKAILLSVHNALQLFTIDASFDTMFGVSDILEDIGANFKATYYTVGAIYYIVAPVLTAGFVMSFLSSFQNFIRFKLSFGKEVYMFSELNQKTVNLAKSIKEKKKRATIVFCDITKQVKEDKDEMFEELLDIKAICLSSDISTVRAYHHSKNSNKGIHFFLISEDDEKLINQYNSLVNTYSQMENGKIYLFSRSSQSDLVFNSNTNIVDENGKVLERKIQCRKYDSDFLIIYNYLFENGYQIFEDAKPIDDKTKQINVLIVGFGLNGKMLTKALAWFCQMDGYRVEINVFDSDPKARDRFAEEAPDLLNPDFAKPKIAEENQYVININPGIDVDTQEFVDKVSAIADKVTYAFTCLGDDERNLATAMKLREIFEKHYNHKDEKEAKKPHIVSVVYTGDKQYVTSATNHKKQNYCLECIGSYEHTYSYDFVIDSALEKAAIGVHTRYGNSTKGLFGYAYNFRSSCASAIHMKNKIRLKIHNAHLARSKLSEADIQAIAAMEHRRWSAWTRGEGYVWGKERNDLAKTHNDLVEYSKLTKEVQDYDVKVGTLDKDADEE